MRLDAPGAPLLTYCTNVHPAESWPEVKDTLERHVPAVRARVSPDAPFGVGLRLSARAVTELEQPAAFEELRDVLARRQLFVFTLNGFPYGAFHGTRVKQAVYAPDWTDARRIAYSDRLARLLARLLPADGGYEGSVSTVPGGFRSRRDEAGACDAIVANLLAHAATLHRLRRDTGRTIALALEPEPGCLLETTDEAVAFLERRLLAASARARFARLADLPVAESEAVLRRHVGLCLDACHAAIEFESPEEALARPRAAGVRIAKIQLTTALRVPRVGLEQAHALRAFAEDVYLHQVVERRGGRLTRWNDLPDALAAWNADPDPEREWRVHFHVPVYAAQLGPLENTQGFLGALLASLRATPASDHLEVETYTWDVLPEAHRGEPLADALARELAWVRERLVA